MTAESIRRASLIVTLLALTTALFAPRAAAAPPVFTFALGGEKGAGNGQFSFPRGAATDSAGNVYVADWGNHRVQKFDPEGEYLGKFGSKGSGNGQFEYPYDVAVDASDNLYVVDARHPRVQKFDSEGEYLSQFGGSGSYEFEHKYNRGIDVDSAGNVYLTGPSGVSKYDSTGKFLIGFGSVWGSGNGQFKTPHDLAVDSTGNIWVTDHGNNRVQKFNSKGEYLSQFGSIGSGNGQLKSPRGIAIDPTGKLLVVDSENHRVQKFDSTGKYLTQFGEYGLADGQFSVPDGIAVGPSGAIWVLDANGHRLHSWEDAEPGTVTLALSGVPLKAGDIVKGSSASARFVHDSGTSQCPSVEFLGEVIKNNSEMAVVQQLGYLEFPSVCSGPSSLNLKVTKGTFLLGVGNGGHEPFMGDETVDLGGYGFDFSFNFGGQSWWSCQADGSGAEPWASNAEESKIDLDLDISQISGAGCPSELHLEGALKLTNSSGAPIEIFDSQPPLTSITSGPKGPAKPSNASFKFASTDPGSTFECAIDEGPYTGCSSPSPYKSLEDGPHTFRVRSTDGSGNEDESPAQRSFVMDSVAPELTIDSPTPSYTAHETWPVTFSSDDEDATYWCEVDEASFDICSSPLELPENLDSGWHTVEVLAVDPAENWSSEKWTFKTGIYPDAPSTSKLVYPEEGKKTASHYTLKAEWGNAPEGGGVTGVTFQMRLPNWDVFKDVPAECTIDGEGKQVSWPLAASGNPGHTEPVFLGVRDCKPFVDAKYPEEEIKFRAVFDGGKNAAGASQPATTEFARKQNGTKVPTDAVQSIGPVSLDLLTGAYTISRTDVSIPVPGTDATLEFTRVYNSSYWPGAPSSTPMGVWKPSTPAEQGYEGGAWAELEERVIPATPEVYEEECWEEEGEEECQKWLVEEAQPEERWMDLLSNEGEAIPFEIQGESYVSPDYAKELKLTRENSTHIVLADPNGTNTTFVKDDGGDYLPKAVSFQATPSSVRMVYEDTESAYVGLRLMRMIAPAPAGVTCGDWTSIEQAGCRTLEFEYLPEDEWDKYSNPPDWYVRLASIRYHNATGANSEVVAKYNYDDHVRLIEAWDPRLPNLKEKYAYHGYSESIPGSPFVLPSLLKSIAPAGEEPWKFGYDYDKSGAPNLLTSVSRASLLANPATATTTIAYDVPISGEDAPYEMSAEEVAKWGQSDFPVDATAIFPPDQVPSSPPSDYTRATVNYMDPDGYLVNTASAAPPGVEGVAIQTSETDEHGNVVRSLGAQARLDALAHEDPLARSKELDSHSTYNADGTRMLESWGPLREVRLESGETVEARAHTTVEYDKGAPEPKEGESWPNLPTKETVGAAIPGVEGDKDIRVTATEYDWNLRKPTATIVDPGGLDLRTVTVYDSNGMVLESRQPSDKEGQNAGTTVNAYYSAQEQSPIAGCRNKPQWANLPCVSYPKADPSPVEGNPKLPWTWTASYNTLDLPTETQEKVDGVLKRTTTATYDEAGRPVQSHETGDGVEVPPSETLYDEDTGKPVGQRFVCTEECEGFDTQEVSTTFDTLGRPVEYEDADGNVSGVAYDLLGRPAITGDGKGTQTATYDGDSGVLTQMVDSAAGTFTTAYDADGKIVAAGLPNGLVAQASYDASGAPTHLEYEKTYCSEDCTWLEFDRESSIHGQVLWQESTIEGALSSQDYAYDMAGRLTLTEDTDAGQCTTRAYSFDKNTNRTELITREPKEGGACDTTSKGEVQEYKYDSADRLLGEGVDYDNLGRITDLPAKYAGGGKLETSYYTTDLTHTQSQDGITNTYELDAAKRQRERIRVKGEEESTEIYHYSGGSDSPSWVDEGEGKWTRSIGAIGGSLGAQQTSGGDITFQIADMHGDVIAIADDDPEATELLSTQRFDEYGNPQQTGFLEGGDAEYGWLGAKRRRTQLPSGVIQMGVRSYVPSLGRFLTPDPIRGGSANAYEYAGGDPINNFDLTGECYVTRRPSPGKCKKKDMKKYKGERRRARSVSRRSVTIVLIERRGGGARASGIQSALEDALDYVHDKVGGGVKKIGNGFASLTLSGPEYKAARKAFTLSMAWSPDRLIQAWQCGEYVAGVGRGFGDCDPWEMWNGAPPDSAR